MKNLDIRHTTVGLLIVIIIATMIASFDNPSGPYDNQIMPSSHVEGGIWEDGSYRYTLELSGCMPFHMWNGRIVMGACLD